MYCHGYSPAPGNFDNPKPNPVLDVFTKEGYAVAQSGDAAGGWAIQEAVQDTEALRRYFSHKYGAPKETYVTGHSMGGFLTMTLLETFPNAYDGGLALCGPLAAASWFLTRRVFDMRVVFDYLFPGALPNPVKIPADYVMGAAKNETIEKLLDSKPEQAAVFRRLTGLRNNMEAAGMLVFFTYILKDLEDERAAILSTIGTRFTRALMMTMPSTIRWLVTNPNPARRFIWSGTTRRQAI
jgi:pimeloyl-ACP methyl ester carboxylesterase